MKISYFQIFKMCSQNWSEIDDESILNALMNETDVLLNLDDFFQEEMMEEDVQDHEEREHAEEVVEMELYGEGGQQLAERVDEGRVVEQGGGDEDQEDIVFIYHVATSDSEDSDYVSDFDSDDSSDSDFEYGFRSHDLDSEGICSRCHMEMPQNQLCN